MIYFTQKLPWWLCTNIVQILPFLVFELCFLGREGLRCFLLTYCSGERSRALLALLFCFILSIHATYNVIAQIYITLTTFDCWHITLTAPWIGMKVILIRDPCLIFVIICAELVKWLWIYIIWSSGLNKCMLFWFKLVLAHALGDPCCRFIQWTKS